MKKIKTLLAIFLVTTILQQCAVNPVTGKKEFMLLSSKDEKAMGVQADPEIVAAYGLYPSESLQGFIDQKGQEMVKVSHRKGIEYQFKILDSPIVNAFALPGGFIYFTRGIMAHLNSEAEFAGVLGHEIGHVAARHSAKQYSRAMVTQLGISLGTVLSPEFAQFADLAQTGASLMFLKYGRDAERESDRLGVEYSTKIGYNAHEMADFFQTLDRMNQGEGQGLPVFLSTHPDPGEREETVHALAEKWQGKTGETNDYQVNRNEYLRMIDGMVYGTDPRQGYIDDGFFFHPELKFQFPVPNQWQTQNTPQQVSMVPPDGNAIMLLSLAQGNSLEAAAQNLASQYQLQDASADNLTINGFRALRLIGLLPGQGNNLAVIVHFIEDGKYIYQFLGATLPDRFSQFRPIAIQIAGGFERLTDPRRIEVTPQKISIQNVSRTQTLQASLSSFGVQSERMNEHAVLNGMLLDESVSAGTLIKVIRGESFDLAGN